MDKTFQLFSDFGGHPKVSGAFKQRRVLVTMLNELQVKGEVELQGRKLLEEGKYTPYPPDRMTFEEYFKGFGWSKGAITFRGLGDATVVTIEADFLPAARRFRRLKGIARRAWTRNYFRRAILGPFKAALEGQAPAAKAPTPTPAVEAEPQVAPGGRTTLFDREAEARAREEIRQREGKPASAGVSPSGEEKRKT